MKENPRTAVVTGASTGIGRACALALDAAGWHVFAGVRREEDANTLRKRASDRLRTCHLDVTRPGEIEAAAAQVAEACGGAGVQGLVNNAGIAVAGPLEFLPMADLEQQFAVNVLGLVRTTQAFLPLLRAGHGRIVNMGSVSGRFALPFVGPYAASKHALEAISDSLRVELRPWGIKVVLLEPGVVRTPIWDKGRAAGDTLRAQMPAACEQYYGAALDRVQAEVDKVEPQGVAPEAVARCVVKALTARRPKARYVLGANARAQLILGGWIPDRPRDWLIAKMLGLGSA
ncbi:MAG: SDR family oxidoreductase [Candidatus Hydrogenedentota bacterium]